MLAWIFEIAGRRPDFLIGGMAENFGRTTVLAAAANSSSKAMNTTRPSSTKGLKFLHYRPDELIMTSLEFDHADIYADIAAIELQFRRLVNLIPRRGRIVSGAEPGGTRQAVSHAFCPVETYGFDGRQRLGGRRLRRRWKRPRISASLRQGQERAPLVWAWRAAQRSQRARAPSPSPTAAA